MTTLRQFLDEQMKNPEFAREYEAIQPEMAVIRAMVDARCGQGLTQKELSERTGIGQAEISKIESGRRNPTIKMLQRIADGMGMRLKIEFVPKRDADGSPSNSIA